ncbi:MAG: response regulator [Bdellovibrionota bacterium]|nr:response regulator [Bdellovibrionota bacterium]
MSNDMIGDFQIEATELLDEAEDSLLELDKGGDYKECYNQLFRAFHSIKGAAGMFGIDDLQKHMHYLENLLSNKQSLENLSTATIDYFLTGVDGARKILNQEDIQFEYYDPDSESPSGTGDTAATTQDIAKEKFGREKNTGEIWLVDDEEDILDILEIHLVEYQYKVKKFLNPLNLLKELETATPDLIVSDINMPEMNGVELVKQVNAKRPHLPVVVVSGFVTKEVCLNIIRDGVTGVIEKPFLKEDFIKLVELNVNRYQSIKLLNKSIDLLIYQFENFPDIAGSEKGFFDHFRAELKYILKQKNNLYKKLR